MTFFQRWRVARLRNEAQRAYLRFMLEAQHYDCGNSLLKFTNPRAAKAARNFNNAMAELKKLDPDCPEWVPL